jgi:hypothetical protein
MCTCNACLSCIRKKHKKSTPPPKRVRLQDDPAFSKKLPSLEQMRKNGTAHSG